MLHPYLIVERCKAKSLRSKIADEARYKVLRYRPYIPKRSLYLKLADLFIQDNISEEHRSRLYRRIDRFEFENKCKI